MSDELRLIGPDDDDAAWRVSAVTFGYADEPRPDEFHFTAPGRTTWVSVIPASASAFCSTRAPASVTGAMAPASVKGVITMT